MALAIEYRVDDRSILLPYYKKHLIEPALRYLPASLHPNTITHAGHLINLLGAAVLLAFWPTRGWPFVFAAVTLHLYVWCDNVDGAHARRTKQASPLGEFLDHGLDQVNMVYIAIITAMALGVSPFWWVVHLLLIPGAGCLAYLEQTQTGVLRMGLLNQVESIVVLGFVLLASAIFGNEAFERVTFHGYSLRLVLCLWSTSTILFGIVRGMVRTASFGGARANAPALPFVILGVAIFASWRVEAISTINAATLATCSNVYFGMRMLSRRLREKPAKVEPLLIVSALVLLLCAALRAAGHSIAPWVGTLIAIAACAAFGLETVRAARSGIQHVVGNS